MFLSGRKLSDLLGPVNKCFRARRVGSAASVTYPSGGWPYQNAPARTVEYNRRLGFLTSIPGYATNFSYQLGGMPYEIKYANNVTWRQTAEADTGWERPDQIDTLTGSGAVLWSSGDYSYDGVGNISQIGTRAYTYDSFSRLEAVKVSGQATVEQQATYDSYGNLINLRKNGVARILTANATTNRLATTDTVYTSNGEIEKVTIDGQDFEYGHDGLGQQIFHKTTGKTWVYAYDASDERVLSWECAPNNCSIGRSYERYTLRGLAGEVLRSFEGPERSQLAWKEDYIYRDGQALSWVKSNGAGGEERLYLHADHLGSTRLVTNTAGAQVSRHDFLPFGEESTATSGGDVALKFTGHERDQPGKPIDYMHARFCSPVLARFMRVDPAGGSARASAPQTWNRYSYVGNNPIKYVDPDGQIIQLASGKSNISVKKALIQQAMRPSGRQALEKLAKDPGFKVRFENGSLNNIALKKLQIDSGVNTPVTFGKTTPVFSHEEQKYTGVNVTIDTQAVGHFHADKSGATTTAHESYHIEGFRQGQTYDQVLLGDAPSSATGPAEKFGQSVASEKADFTAKQAEKYIDALLLEGSQR